MSHDQLNILVLIRETSDPRPPAKAITRGAGISERGLRRIANPTDLIALEEALHLKDRIGARVEVLCIGPDRLDDTIRLAYSMGADRGIRFWDHGLEGGDAVADARLLTRIVTILAPDLVFAGNRLLDLGDDPVPALAAAKADIPCISAAVSLSARAGGIEVLRKGDRGARQSVAADYPCAVLFDEGRTPRYPSVDQIVGTLDLPIEEWDLANLGLPFWEVGSAGAVLSVARFATPRQDPVRVATPDATLPAFERILSLLSGGIKAREGKLQTLSAPDTVSELWRILAEEGLIPEGAQ